jgi:hypothetical protein
VTMAAVLYVFRTLVDDDIPLNAGCLQAAAGDRARGLACSTRTRPRRWWRATSRPRMCVTERAVRRAGRDGGVAVHDEQLHLRQRRATSTTRPSPAAAAPACVTRGRLVGGFAARAWCRRT